MRYKVMIGVLVLIVASLFWRVNAFWAQHWKGDQSHYAVLAMKLATQGLDGYNMREIRLGKKVYNKDGVEAVMMVCKPHIKGYIGDVLPMLKTVGQGYYDEPLHMRAPLFPLILSWSHQLFSPGQVFELFCGAMPGPVVRQKPWEVFRAQFWAAIVPVFFNLSLILLTFTMASRFFNYRVGFLAALLLATNPVSLFVCHRLLTEDVASLFIGLSLFMFWLFLPKRNWLGLFLAGVVAGLATLTRQTAGSLVFVAWTYLMVCDGKRQWCWRGWIKNMFHPAMILFGIGMLAVSGFWFLKVYQVYGHPLHVPIEGMRAVLKSDTTGWFRTLGYKTPPVLFFSWDVILLCPLFVMSLWTITDYNRRAQKLWQSQAPTQERKDPVVFLWLWVIAFYLWAAQPWLLLNTAFLQESRYFYPAYPAIAVLSAWGIERVRIQMIERWGHTRWVDAGICLALMANMFYTLAKFAPYLTANLMMI